MAIVVIMTDFRVQPLETIQSQVSYSLPPCGFDNEKHRNPTAYGIARDLRTVVTVLSVDTSCRKVVSEILRGCQVALSLHLDFRSYFLLLVSRDKRLDCDKAMVE